MKCKSTLKEILTLIKEGAKETCFGNWIDKGEDGADRNVHLKQQVAPCNELGCPSKIFGLATTGLFICHTCRLGQSAKCQKTRAPNFPKIAKLVLFFGLMLGGGGCQCWVGVNLSLFKKICTINFCNKRI